jgi:hypothetical protein
MIFIRCFKGNRHRRDKFFSPEQIATIARALAELLTAASK